MRHLIAVVLSLIISLFLFSTPVRAQTGTQPEASAGQLGVVTGKLVNLSKDGNIPEKIELMAHIWDQNVDKGMLHGTSRPDGTFSIEEVPLLDGAEYLVMAVYQDVTYSSKSLIYKTNQNLNFEIPIRETTSDVSTARVDQMHVLFNAAVDGLEVKEIYILSNTGDRTIKDSIKIKDDTLATFAYPLPADADYIFFKPDDDSSRFVKYSGGFADKAPLLPGENSGQFMVSYLVPFNGQKQFSYTATSDIKQVNFLVPADAGITISGEGLGTPQTTSLQGGANYFMYSLPELQVGQTITYSISVANGTRVGSLSGKLPLSGMSAGIAIGGGVLGLSLVVLSVWLAVKNKKNTGDDATIPDDTGLDFDAMVTKIALLDQAYARGELAEDEYREERTRLKKQAKELIT